MQDGKAQDDSQVPPHRARSVHVRAAPAFPLTCRSCPCACSAPTVHLCAKVHTPSTHTGTGEGTGLEAGVLGLSVMMKSCLAVAVQLEAEEGTDGVPCSLLLSPASLHCCSFSASENHS